MVGDHIFSDNGQKYIQIEGSDANHIICVLRKRPGDVIVCCDMQRTEYGAVIEKASEDRVLCRVTDEKTGMNEPPAYITLYQSLPKSDKMDMIIQKAVELGVSRVVPMASERCVAKLDSDNISKKDMRWKKIANEAAKQCGRSRLVEIVPCIRYEQAIAEISQNHYFFICYEGQTTRSIRDIFETPRVHDGDSKIGFMIGPEGGFSNEEIALAKANNIHPVTLGPRILRTETASGCVLSLLMLLTHEI